MADARANLLKRVNANTTASLPGNGPIPSRMVASRNMRLCTPEGGIKSESLKEVFTSVSAGALMKWP